MPEVDPVLVRQEKHNALVIAVENALTKAGVPFARFGIAPPKIQIRGGWKPEHAPACPVWHCILIDPTQDTLDRLKVSPDARNLAYHEVPRIVFSLTGPKDEILTLQGYPYGIAKATQYKKVESLVNAVVHAQEKHKARSAKLLESDKFYREIIAKAEALFPGMDVHCSSHFDERKASGRCEHPKGIIRWDYDDSTGFHVRDLSGEPFHAAKEGQAKALRIKHLAEVQAVCVALQKADEDALQEVGM